MTEEIPPTVREIEDIPSNRRKILGHVELKKLPRELVKQLRWVQILGTIKEVALPARLVNLAFIPLNAHDPSAFVGIIGEVAGRKGDEHVQHTIREATDLFAKHSGHPEIARMLGMDEKPTHLVAWRRKLYFVKAPKKYEGKAYTPFMRQPRIPVPK